MNFFSFAQGVQEHYHEDETSVDDILLANELARKTDHEVFTGTDGECHSQRFLPDGVVTTISIMAVKKVSSFNLILIY